MKRAAWCILTILALTITLVSSDVHAQTSSNIKVRVVSPRTGATIDIPKEQTSITIVVEVEDRGGVAKLDSKGVPIFTPIPLPQAGDAERPSFEAVNANLRAFLGGLVGPPTVFSRTKAGGKDPVTVYQLVAQVSPQYLFNTCQVPVWPADMTKPGDYSPVGYKPGAMFVFRVGDSTDTPNENEKDQSEPQLCLIFSEKTQLQQP